MTAKRFTTWGNKIKRNGKLLNIEFKTKTDAKLCCKLCNQMDKDNQEYIDELNDIFKWYKEYYGENILDTKMGWNDNNKISKLEKENEQLKQSNEDARHLIWETDEMCNVFDNDLNVNSTISVEDVVDLLNELHEENQRLNQTLENIQKELNKYNNEWVDL